MVLDNATQLVPVLKQKRAQTLRNHTKLTLNPAVHADPRLDRVTPSQMPCTGTEIALC